MTKSDFLLIAGALVALYVVKEVLPKSEEQKEAQRSSERKEAEYQEAKAKTCPTVKTKIDPLISTGFIMTHSKDWNDIKVGRAWYQTPLDMKERTVNAISMCLSRGEMLSVYDGYSGELLAKNGLLGMKVYK